MQITLHCKAEILNPEDSQGDKETVQFAESSNYSYNYHSTGSLIEGN